MNSMHTCDILNAFLRMATQCSGKFESKFSSAWELMAQWSSVSRAEWRAGSNPDERLLFDLNILNGSERKRLIVD